VNPEIATKAISSFERWYVIDELPSATGPHTEGGIETDTEGERRQ
jgi:hypothetical protein